MVMRIIHFFVLAAFLRVSTSFVPYIYNDPNPSPFLPLRYMHEKQKCCHSPFQRDATLNSRVTTLRLHRKDQTGCFHSDKEVRAPSLSTRRNFLSVGLSVAAAITTIFTTYPPQDLALASTTDRQTGVLLPSEGEIESSIPSTWDDDSDNPAFLSQDKFTRLDSTSDSIFYTNPRFVEHVDVNAVQTMTSYISNTILHPNDAVLDLCSSWTSHIDPAVGQTLKRVSGLGMNPQELERNALLTDWTVQDLNVKPNLPYDDSTYDVVLCQLSIDYLTKPLEVLEEVGRVLKPGGVVVVLFSNRLFLSKAVALWTGADDVDHAYIVGSYLHYCNGGFEQIKAVDLSARRGRRGKDNDRPIVGDPLYAVTATKSTVLNG